MASKAAFLDRDGTILVERGHVTHPDAIQLLPGAVEAIAALRAAGWKLVVVTNQSHVARGVVTPTQLESIQSRFEQQLANAGAPLDGNYHCPHHPDGLIAEFSVVCDCRKPKPGLLLRAAAEHDVELSASVMVGDAVRDLEAGRAAGVAATVLVRTGHGEASLDRDHGASHVATDLTEASTWILNGQGRLGETTGETAENADQ